jgi:hypothetical protein
MFVGTFSTNIAWCSHEILHLLTWSFSRLNVAIVFDIKIMGNLLCISHILSRMSNRLLLLLLLASVLLLHLKLLSCYHLVVLNAGVLRGSKIVLMLLLARFTLFNYLRFEF